MKKVAASKSCWRAALKMSGEIVIIPPAFVFVIHPVSVFAIPLATLGAAQLKTQRDEQCLLALGDGYVSRVRVTQVLRGRERPVGCIRLGQSHSFLSRSYRCLSNRIDCQRG